MSCQFSLYPLRQEKLGEILAEAVRELDRVGVSYRVGTMGTEMEGEDEEVFHALHSAFVRVAERGDAVLVATVSNACGG
ncbi:MAG: thiamine-binding protein [Actinobacteria bacterium]|nr:thiamine-binding protein [Actinomycetota bacterium]